MKILHIVFTMFFVDYTVHTKNKFHSFHISAFLAFLVVCCDEDWILSQQLAFCQFMRKSFLLNTLSFRTLWGASLQVNSFSFDYRHLHGWVWVMFSTQGAFLYISACQNNVFLLDNTLVTSTRSEICKRFDSELKYISGSIQ